MVRRGPDDDPDADLRDDGDAAADVETVLGPELDLHHFQPREVADVVAEYVRAAQEAGMRSVRIIHGKGVGTLRRIVHGVVEKHPAVESFTLGDERSGSWGATLVVLKQL